MYLMTYNNHTPAWQSDPNGEAAMAVAMAKQLIADSSSGLVFDEKEHRYFLGDIEIQCVSSVVKEFAPFDAEEKAKKCSRNPKHQHFGKTPEEILAIWEEKRDASAAAGTAVHEFGEACFLVKTGEAVSLPEAFKDRLTEEGFEARTPKEEAVARWWDALDMKRYVPVAKELRIVNPRLRYAGTFDLLLYDLADHCYILKDYKTNADLFRDYGDKLRAPLSMIKASDHGKYTLQQNLYWIQLHNIGITVSNAGLIWLKEDGTYMDVPIDDRRTVISWAMEKRIDNN